MLDVSFKILSIHIYIFFADEKFLKKEVGTVKEIRMMNGM